MNVIGGNVHTTHTVGAFSARVQFEFYSLYCFETPFLYERDGKLFSGNVGDVLINTPGAVVYHGPMPDAKQGFVNDWLYLESDELTALLKQYPLPLNTAFSVGRPLALRSLFHKLRAETISQAIGYQQKQLALLTEGIIDLYRDYTFQKNATLPHVRLELIREKMLCAPEKAWTLEEMATDCGYSVSRFCALYKEQFGIAPKQELMAARLLMAQQLLQYSGNSVTDIATACGFQSLAHFSRYFKDNTGVSPQKYKKQQ